jgi:hypothetical protein
MLDPVDRAISSLWTADVTDWASFCVPDAEGRSILRNVESLRFSKNSQEALGQVHSKGISNTVPSPETLREKWNFLSVHTHGIQAIKTNVYKTEWCDCRTTARLSLSWEPNAVRYNIWTWHGRSKWEVQALVNAELRHLYRLLTADGKNKL